MSRHVKLTGTPEVQPGVEAPIGILKTKLPQPYVVDATVNVVSEDGKVFAQTLERSLRGVDRIREARMPILHDHAQLDQIVIGPNASKKDALLHSAPSA